MVPSKVMFPATLLLLVLTILHTSNHGAFVSCEAGSTSLGEYLTFLDTIKDPIIRRATEIRLSKCLHIDICSVSFGLEDPEFGPNYCKNCRCDVDCNRECCPNFVAELDQLARSEGNELECRYPALQPSQKIIFEKFSVRYYFITDCPPGYDFEMRKSCRRLDNEYVISEEFDFSNVTPVTDIRSQLNYWNRFCVSCHGIVKENLLAWDVSLNCKNSFLSDSFLKERIMHMINTTDCDITFQPPKLYTPTKCRPLISSCNQTGLWLQYDEVIERLCDSPLGSSYYYIYKNVFCMICNNSSTIPMVDHSGVDGTSGVSFSILLNVRRQEREHPELTQCPSQMVFDPYLMKCRQLYCSPTKTLNKDKCVNIFSQIQGVFFEIEITFFPLERCPVALAREVAKKIGTWFDSLLFCSADTEYDHCKRDTLYKVNNSNTVVTDHYIAKYSPIVNSSVTFISSKWWFRVKGFCEIDRVYEIISNITNSTVSFQMSNYINITLSPRLTRVFDIASSSPITFPANLSDHPLTNTSDFGTDDEDDIQGCSSDINYFERGYNSFLISNACTTLVPSLLNPCTMVELDKQLFNWSYTEFGVTVTKLNLSLNMTDFIIVNNSHGTSLRICTHVYLPSPVVTEDTFQRHVSFEADDILSIICTSMSLICLLLTLIVYIVFPELQTLPGKNNMLLVINLFLAQVMYIVFGFTPTSTDSICKGVGVLLHFFWLSAIFWMNVCTFHMLKKFVKLRRPNAKTSKSKHVIIYMVIVIVSSLIFVLTNIIKASVESGMVEMGYGSRICYISSGKMVGLTFALPVGFVVLSNLVMFSVVIFKLRSLPRVEMNVKQSRNNTLVLAKLSSLTGITWIFGFLYLWTDEIIFSFFFIVLNASIGIFIMASFILNKRVINLIRSKFSNVETMPTGSE